MVKKHEMKFEWYWCKRCGPTIVCPSCGNWCCNGSYGNDGKCKICALAYQYQDLCCEVGKVPSTEKECMKFPRKHKKKTAEQKLLEKIFGV